jgi:drug/metabolite transporter (DMT)-like permease
MGFCWIACIVYRAIFIVAKTTMDGSVNILPLSICTVGTILFGNISIKFLFPSFSAMLGATTPGVILVIQACLTDVTFNSWVFVAVPMMVLGVMFCTAGEATLSWYGISAQLLATVFRASKTLFQKKILCGSSRVSPLALLELMSPQCLLLGIVFQGVIEGTEPIESLLVSPSLQIFLYLMLNSANAFFLNLSNFSVSSEVWPITLQLIGSVKTIFGVVLSGLIFHNPVGVLQWIGCVLGCVGVILYNGLGASSPRKQASLPKSVRDAQNSME